MVLEVLAHAGKVNDCFNTSRLKDVTRPNAAEL